VNASGTISASVNPAAGETLTIGGTTYTFVAGAPAANGQVHVDPNSTATTMANLAHAINGDVAGAAGNWQSAGADAHVTAAANGNVVTITSISAVPATGNGYGMVDANGAGNGAITLSGATLAGGTAAANNVPVQVNNVLTSASDAQATLGLVNTAIANVASQRGQIGAEINRLQAASNVMSVQVKNLTAAQDQIMAANIPQQVTNLSEYSILNQSGISALAQANSSQQSILKLLQ
jgi:flagellin